MIMFPGESTQAKRKFWNGRSTLFGDDVKQSMQKGTKHKKDYRGTPIARFWAKVIKGDECWLWTGAKNYNGYGAFRVNNRNQFPHRFSWELHSGSIPRGSFVCHSCDNPSCVNPKHLWLGSNSDNVHDMVRKRRHTFGERNPMSKLTEKEVLEIRRMGRLKSLSQISRRFSLGISTVSQILNRHRWKHI